MMNIKMAPGADGKPAVDLSQLGFWTYMGLMFESEPRTACHPSLKLTPTFSDFPNFFAGTGPTAFSLGGSIIDAAEDGTDWSIRVIKKALAKNLKSIEPTHEAIENWIGRFDKRVEGMP